MGIYQGEITGTLISRQSGVGTLSEGPVYFICPTDQYAKWGEIQIWTKVMRWMKDPVLHGLIGEEITLKGEITETKDTITLEYTGVLYKGKLIPAHQESGKVVLSPAEVDDRLKEYLEKKSDD
jgi:hypothetical protein